MCGICGFLKNKNTSRVISEQLLREMTDRMILRGPDGSGIWINRDDTVGLGHRRLSIIDLSDAAGQPMSNQDGSVVICFNGEIYNHKEIREELEAKNRYVWKTDHSDTEVIVHAYEEWGIECIHRFRGIFGIAIWDAKKKRMYLIRDRIGVKPLYYTFENGILYFASEIKAILPALTRKPDVNHVALYDYLSFLTTPGEDTLFQGIKKLRPGVYMTIDTDGKTSLNQYWDVWDHTVPDLYHADDAEISERIISELRRSVEYRKESDVPVGVFLSGGIDSSTNAALFSENNKNIVKTFCIGYDRNYESYQNENHYARQMAEFCGAEYYERLLTQKDLLDFVPEMVRLQDEPIADPVCVPVYYVSKLARDNGIIVAQVGEGSDELFWGYSTWKTALKCGNLDNITPVCVEKLVYKIFNLVGKNRSFYTELVRRGSLHQPVFWGGAEAFYEYDKKRMLSDRLRRELDGYTSFEAISGTYKTFKEKAWEKSNLNWMSYVDLRHRLPELLLMRVDKMSMGVSLEARVPFLDHKFVELAMSIPAKKKSEGGISKTVLKKAVRGIIPDELIDRKKQGFGVPVNDWVMSELGDEMRKEIKLFSDETGLLDYSYISNMFEGNAYAGNMWFLYNLAMWWKEFIR